MKKWPVTLSTTDASNYIGIVKVRQGNLNTEVLEATVIENGVPLDLTGCRATFQVKIGQVAVERPCSIVNPQKGIVEYIFDAYTMQAPGRFFANIAFEKGEELIGTTQDFSYFVIRAVSKTEGEVGSYWQSVEDLISDMTEYINSNRGDFDKWMKERKEEFEAWRNKQQGDYNAWFESIKDVLAQIDPGGKMLLELMDARVDLQGVRHDSISERLLADFDYLYQRLEERLYTLNYGDIDMVDVLQDDKFSANHTVKKVGTVSSSVQEAGLVIATVDDPKQDVFKLKKVGVI